MDLKTYLAAKRGRATWLAAQLDGVSPSYLSQMASGDAPISPKRGVEIEVVTGGQVTRQEMFLNDWKAIWPELPPLPIKAAPARRKVSAGPP